MARTDDDNWDLTSSVGVTATIVAVGRALATKDPRGLINDPFAEPLVRAVGLDLFTKMMDGELDMSTIADVSPAVAQAMVYGNAVRTKYFDDYLLNATAGGIRQVAILASGLDSRAYRLPWPTRTVVYEIDQPKVMEFKTTTLADLGAEPSAIRRAVPIDLRADWPTALQAAGFDSAAPTAWLAEGLLIYLKPQTQDRLFDNITALSAPGSMVATEFVTGIADFSAERARTYPTRSAVMAWTSTWLRWSTPAHATTSSTTSPPRAGNPKACRWQNCSGAAVSMCALQTTTPSSSAAA